MAQSSWMAIPPSTAPVTPLDTLIVEFQAIGARLRAQGLESPDFVPDAFPNVAPILATPSFERPLPTSTLPSSSSSSPRCSLSVSSIIVGHISVAHSHMRSLVSRLAAVWSVFSTVRWPVRPSSTMGRHSAMARRKGQHHSSTPRPSTGYTLPVHAN
ncbi:hypothetical protein Sste5346_009105 [Sporothrix stenoceras]|uniref:Uncharacterized protein n=1 Tax=Sporothrix stenoceras TaxID=5173 RepID=A0ABR3YLI5_9PEZI